jgi:hypothetical protein
MSFAHIELNQGLVSSTPTGPLQNTRMATFTTGGRGGAAVQICALDGEGTNDTQHNAASRRSTHEARREDDMMTTREEELCTQSHSVTTSEHESNVVSTKCVGFDLTR